MTGVASWTRVGVAGRARREITQPATIALLALLVLSAGMRAWFMLRWRPALLGFPDSGVYILSARTPFSDHARPGGYPAFLGLLNALDGNLSFVPAVQHVLGLAAALLLYLAARAAGAGRWAALLPAAVVGLEGAELWLEHAVLSESLFVFLTALALCAAVLAGTRARRPALALLLAALAGLAAGSGVTVRVAGVFALPVVVAYLALAPRDWRRRLAGAGVAGLAAGAVIFAYSAWHHDVTGRWGLTVTGFYNLYGRVAPFADCSKFTPPSNARSLCPTIPVRDRQGHEFWLFTPQSPLVRRYGDGAFATPPPSAAGTVRGFARAAVLGQPGAYLTAIRRDL